MMGTKGWQAWGWVVAVVWLAGCGAGPAGRGHAPAAAPATATACTMPSAAPAVIPLYEGQGKPAPEDERARALLDKVLPEVRVEGARLDEVLAMLGELGGVRIEPDWATLEEAGVTPASPVMARLRNVKLARGLRTILSDVAGAEAKAQPGFHVREGTIRVTTRAKAYAEELVTYAHDVRDLMMETIDLDEPPVLGEDPAGRSGETGLIMVRDRLPARPEVVRGEEEPLPTWCLMGVRDAIAHAADDASWEAAGGRERAIRFVSGQFVVTQTPEHHRKVAAEISRVRGRLAAPSFDVEAKVLRGARRILRDVGARWEPAYPGTAYALGIPNVQDVFVARLTDDEAERLLLRAAQGSPAVEVLTLPRLRVGPRGAARTSTVVEHPYVRAYEVRPRDGALAGLTPVMGTARTGIVAEASAWEVEGQPAPRCAVEVWAYDLVEMRATPHRPVAGEPVPPGRPLVVQKPVFNRLSIQVGGECREGQWLLGKGLWRYQDGSDVGGTDDDTAVLFRARKVPATTMPANAPSARP